MKRITKGLLMTALCTLFFAGSALAVSGVAVKADIPFSFFAGDELFPAGQYVMRVDDPEEPDLLTIEDGQGARHEFVLTTPETPTKAGGFLDESKLVFNRYGMDHFLAEVEVAGFDEGRALPVSRLERERREMSRDKVTVHAEKAG